MTSSDGSERLRDRALSIFRYLIELAQLRAKVVRDIDEYEHVFWFDDVPNVAGCYSIRWGDPEGGGDDAWLEIRGQPEPKCPAAPGAATEPAGV